MTNPALLYNKYEYFANSKAEIITDPHFIKKLITVVLWLEFQPELFPVLTHKIFF